MHYRFGGPVVAKMLIDFHRSIRCDNQSPGIAGCVGTIGGSGLTGASFVSGSRCPDIDGSKDVVGKD
jgi:hypothetical protein